MRVWILLAACGSTPPASSDRTPAAQAPVVPSSGDPAAGETVRFTALEPLAALPEGWSDYVVESPKAWRDVELASTHGSYRIVATRGDKRWSAELACCADGFELEMFERGPTIAGIETGSIVFDVTTDGGKRIELVACARDAATVLRCSAPIELHNGDLRDELDYKLVPTRDGLLLSPTGASRKRRLVFALP